MTVYWFKPKRYGYGATPVTWQGWAVTGGSLLVVVAASLLPTLFGSQHPWPWLVVLAIDAATLLALWIITRHKTDGEWRWRWGN